MKPYISALTNTDLSIAQLGKLIHNKESRIWQMEKSLEKKAPYCFRFKRLDVPMEIIITKSEVRQLRAKREKVYKETPKELWYPRKKYCGRYNNRENDIKTKIMKDCIRYGWNAKEIADYFKITLGSVYKRIKIKKIGVFVNEK